MGARALVPFGRGVTGTRPAVSCIIPVMDTLLHASRERAWSQLDQMVNELEQALLMRERTRHPGTRKTDDFAISLRRDNVATALKQLTDIQRRTHVRHAEGLR